MDYWPMITGGVAVFGTLMAALVKIVTVCVGLASRLTRMEERVNTLSDFFVRRAKVELVKLGWGTQQSPVKITTASFEKMQPLLTELLPFYAVLITKNPKLTDGSKESERTLMEAFESRFGDFIVERVCIPYGMSQGACLIAAMQACQIEYRRTTNDGG